MHPRISLFVFVICLAIATSTSAGDRLQYSMGGETIHGGHTPFAKAAGDTIDLMGPTGSGAPYIGDFESGWSGWTSVDITQSSVTHWQVSDYNQVVAGNLAAWCGDIAFESCNDSLDPVGGYGNSWHDLLAYRTTVADPSLSATVTVAATVQLDSEPGYDYLHFGTKFPGDMVHTNTRSWDGNAVFAVNEEIVFLPSNLTDGTDVIVNFRFTSDGGWSDADCMYPSVGACQIDDITVTITQTGHPDIISFTDFQDNTFGDWTVSYPQGVGDFAAIWSGLNDVDPCRTNFSNQVAFIDDGGVVPGTGGSDCINWCYGPQGYIVTTTGGLAGPTDHIQNDLISPDVSWPDETMDGIILAFDVYRHEDLSADAPGVFYQWGIASADTDNSAGNGFQDINDQGYQDRTFVYYGGPDYIRATNDVTDLMNPGRDLVRVRLGVYQLGWAWGWVGNDGYPAPYFDNVSIKVFPHLGPGMSARELDLANDNFPEIDELDFGNLGSMHVRLDAANNISLAAHLRNDPGDSIVVNIVPIRTGATLAGSPEFHYTIDANPVFDPFRTTSTSGVVLGERASRNGYVYDYVWAFDLPDTGTLFPGDVLHYYISAADEVAGDYQVATMPQDLSGFGDFNNPLVYNSTFVVHALPTITHTSDAYTAPEMLFWNDFANRGGQDEWFGALQQLSLLPGYDYDIYYTNAPSSGVGNGIGGRTAGSSLALYNELLYSGGDLGVNTISNGDFNNDAGDDIGALLNWLSAGGKDLLITGDAVAIDLSTNSGASGSGFVETVMGLNVLNSDIRSFIGNQTSPLVLAVPGNSVFQNVNSWIAYGGCFRINSFDAVSARSGAERLAEFTDPQGNAGAYGFAAATLNTYNTTNRVISLPYDLMNIYTDPNAKITAPLADRTRVLAGVLDFFGVAQGAGEPSPVPVLTPFAVSSYPNPFNPATRLDYTIPAAGHLKLKIYNVRGELVRSLIDGPVTEGGFVVWDGVNQQGGQVSSGVYFYEARIGGEVKVGKMALVK